MVAGREVGGGDGSVDCIGGGKEAGESAEAEAGWE